MKRIMAALVVLFSFACEQTTIRQGKVLPDDDGAVFVPQEDMGGGGTDERGVQPGDDVPGWQPEDNKPEDIYVPPGAEQCNGLDDDDDGEVDEEGAYGCTDFFLDSDQDGWGIGAAKCLCQPGVNHTATKLGDCLDDSPYVNPDAEEDCYNIIDDDCDGTAQFPDCEGKQCGPDGCGGQCATCPENHDCVDFVCKSNCTPQCVGKECGANGCGGTCGTCQGNEECSGGTCLCIPSCAGKNCGPNGCGGTCGSCGSGQICDTGNCVCQAQCAGKECGADSCGGSCGNCSSYQTCSNFQCLGWKYEAESGGMGHEQGKKEGDGWACNTNEHTKNYMLYGPYDTGVPAGNYVAYFRMMVDNNTAGSDTVVKLDIADATANNIKANKGVKRNHFNGAFSYQDFSLSFSWPGASHKLETRVQWQGTAYIKIDRVTVVPQ